MSDEQQAPAPLHLPASCLTKIFHLLSARDLARVVRVNKHWCDVSTSDILWQPLVQQAYLLEQPKTRAGRACPCFHAAYCAWSVDPVGKAYTDLIPRVSTALQAIKSWLQVAAPPVFQSLQPGVSEEELNEAEGELGEPLPALMRVLYRLVNGQDLYYDSAFDKSRGLRRCAHESCFHGLFGGYSVYTHVASTRMYPLARLVRMTLYLRDKRVLPARGSVVFGASFNLAKLLEVGLSDASIRVSTAMVDPEPAFIRASPQSSTKDGLLHWLENYADRLSSGLYEVGPVIQGRDNTQGIILYPIRQPQTAVAITRGVKVEFSAVMVPEQSMVTSHFQRYMFAYCVRFALLDLDEQQDLLEGGGGQDPAAPPGRPMQSCQLKSRHWYICDGREVEEVQGEAVVGQYPLLTAGGEPFSYQSCTEQSSHVGWMEGKFTFVEGSLAVPEGPGFEVDCPRLHMQLPDFIY